MVQLFGRTAAETLMQPLRSLFGLFASEEAEAFAVACINNGQIWSASLCRSEYIPEFLATCGSVVSREALKALRYQITNNKWYDPADFVSVRSLAAQLSLSTEDVLAVARDHCGLAGLQVEDDVERKTALTIKGICRRRRAS